MSTQKNLITLCFATLFTLGLAACGGGGGDAPVPGMADAGADGADGADMEPTAAEQLAAAEARVGTAQTAVDTLPADAIPEQVGAAHFELTAAQQALTAAQNLPENLAASQMSDVAGLVTTAQMLVDDLTETSSDGDVATANAAVMAADTALEGATALSPESMSSLGGQIMALEMTVSTNDDARTAYMVMQARSSVNMTVASAQTAVGRLSSSSTAQEIADAQASVEVADAALDGVMNLPADEVSALRLVVGSLGARIMSVTADGMELVAAQRVSSLYQAVQGARNDADTAADNAAAAAMSATDNEAKRTTRAVSGESETARENSQAVLVAGMDASAAVSAAKAAKAALEALDTERIDPGHKAVLDQAIEEAMEYADKRIEEAELSETDTELDVAKVEGPDMDDPMTAADDATAVAAAVKTALAMINVDENIAAPMGAVKHDGSKIGAMTWGKIVGAGVMTVRRFDETTITEVMAMSVDGSKASDFFAVGGGPMEATVDDAMVVDGEDYDNASSSYKGIAGEVFCGGSDCTITGDTNVGFTLAGSWYFTPTSTDDELYVANPDEAGLYMVATQYARYGYWLTYEATNGAATGVRTYAAVGAEGATNVENLNLGLDSDENPVTASYTGPAVGISVMNDSKGAAAASGHFDATVSLTARFGANPTLGGNITGFVGNAVNAGWNVLLNQSALTDAAALGTGNGIAYGGAVSAGMWTAQGYGPAQVTEGDEFTDSRPEGFFGRFDAEMLDGAVAGAYVTRAAN